MAILIWIFQNKTSTGTPFSTKHCLWNFHYSIGFSALVEMLKKNSKKLQNRSCGINIWLLRAVTGTANKRSQGDLEAEPWNILKNPIIIHVFPACHRACPAVPSLSPHHLLPHTAAAYFCFSNQNLKTCACLSQPPTAETSYWVSLK